MIIHPTGEPVLKELFVRMLCFILFESNYLAIIYRPVNYVTAPRMQSTCTSAFGKKYNKRVTVRVVNVVIENVEMEMEMQDSFSD